MTLTISQAVEHAMHALRQAAAIYHASKSRSAQRCIPEGAPPAHPVELYLAADAADFLHLVQI